MEEFSPHVETGIEALLLARDDSDKDAPFNPVSLRYIDAFPPTLTGGRDTAAFLSEVLKIEVILPPILAKYSRVDQQPKPFVIVTIPLSDGTLRLNAGDAIIAGTSAIILDMTFSTVHPVDPNRSAVMNSLNNAHSIIQSIFLQLTEPIRDLMQPEQ